MNVSAKQNSLRVRKGCNSRLIVSIVVGFLTIATSFSNAKETISTKPDSLAQVNTVLTDNRVLTNLAVDDQGFTYNTSSDGFISMGGFDLPRSQACNLLLDFDFKEPMFRPGLFEVFWASDPGAFGEQQKARFLISHKHTSKPTLFVIPLCKLYSYSGNLNQPHHQRNIVGLRLDYPMNRVISIKLNQIRLYSNAEFAKFEQTQQRNGVTIIPLEPFERLSGTDFRSFDVAIPKVYFGIENGLSRMTNDLPFLLFWGLILLLFIILFVRSYSNK